MKAKANTTVEPGEITLTLTPAECRQLDSDLSRLKHSSPISTAIRNAFTRLEDKAGPKKAHYATSYKTSKECPHPNEPARKHWGHHDRDR